MELTFKQIKEIKEILDNAVKRSSPEELILATKRHDQLREKENLKALENIKNRSYPEDRPRIDPKDHYDIESTGGPYGRINVTAKEKKTGREAGAATIAVMSDSNLESKDTYVYEKDKGKGLATALYKKAEEETGKKMVPSKFQTDEGKAFWKAEESKILPKRSFGVEPELKDKLRKALHSINSGKFWSIAPSLQGIPAGMKAIQEMRKGNKDGAIDAIMESLSPSGERGSLWEGVKGLNSRKRLIQKQTEG